jgi:hypothetical protein
MDDDARPLIGPEQQRRLVATARAVRTPYDLVSYDPEGRRLLVAVLPEPRPPMALVRLGISEALLGIRPDWAPLWRSLVATGTN